jgi:hypothetical protein
VNVDTMVFVVVPAASVVVDITVVVMKEVSAGPMGEQLEVTVRNSVVPGPEIVLYIVFVTRDVSAGAASVQFDVNVTKSVVAGPATVL